MEELDHEFLNTYLKYWADKFTFPAEIKGGQIYPDYDWIIVCSNWPIEEIIGNNKDGTYNRVLDTALRRRFAFPTKTGKYWSVEDIEKACEELKTRDTIEEEVNEPTPKRTPECSLIDSLFGSGYQ